MTPALYRLPVLSMVICVAALVHGPIAGAGDWQITPRFSIEETFTDNATQAENDTLDDFITEIRPGFSLRGRGARVSSNIDYNFLQTLFANNPNFDDRNHQLQGDTQVELIRNRLFIETDSSISQQLSDGQGLVSQNQRSRNGNRSDVTRYRVGPRLQERFGQWLNAELEYTFDSVSFSDDTSNNTGGARNALSGSGNNSDEQRIDLQLSSGAKIARTPIRFAFESREVEFEDGSKDEFRSVEGEVSYVFSRKFIATFTTGADFNDFRTTRGNNDGFYWTAGGTWRPTPRTNIEGEWGDRFFGDTFNISVDHRHRRWTFDFNYRREVRTANDIQRDVVLVPLRDNFGSPVFDPQNSSIIFVPTDTTSVRNESSVSEDLSLTAAYRMRRGSMSVRFIERTRNFEVSNIEEITRNLRVEWSRSLSQQSQLQFTALFRQAEQQLNNAGDFVSLRGIYSYRLGPHTQLRLSYEFADQSGSDGGRNGYTENSGILGLLFFF